MECTCIVVLVGKTVDFYLGQFFLFTIIGGPFLRTQTVIDTTSSHLFIFLILTLELKHYFKNRCTNLANCKIAILKVFNTGVRFLLPLASKIFKTNPPANGRTFQWPYFPELGMHLRFSCKIK